VTKIQKQVNQKKPKTSTTRVTTATASPTDEAAALESAADAIGGYNQSVKALERAVAVVDSAEQKLEKERQRLAAAEANLLTQDHDEAIDWDADPEFNKAQRRLQQARSVARACRLQLQADGEAIITAQADFLTARAAAAQQAINDWKQKYVPLITEASRTGARIQQVFETTIDELQGLPAVHTPDNTPTAWTKTARQLETLVRSVKLEQETRGRWKIQSPFEFSGRDFVVGQIVDEATFTDPRVLQRLKARNMIVSAAIAQGEEHIGIVRPPRKPGAINAGPEQAGLLQPTAARGRPPVSTPSTPNMEQEDEGDSLSVANRNLQSPGVMSWNRPGDRP
jgi:hypothetical protein